MNTAALEMADEHDEPEGSINYDALDKSGFGFFQRLIPIVSCLRSLATGKAV